MRACGQSVFSRDCASLRRQPKVVTVTTTLTVGVVALAAFQVIPAITVAVSVPFTTVVWLVSSCRDKRISPSAVPAKQPPSPAKPPSPPAPLPFYSNFQPSCWIGPHPREYRKMTDEEIKKEDEYKNAEEAVADKLVRALERAGKDLECKLSGQELYADIYENYPKFHEVQNQTEQLNHIKKMTGPQIGSVPVVRLRNQKTPASPMQDDVLVGKITFSSGGIRCFGAVYGVFDGHGKKGHVVAAYCRVNLLKALVYLIEKYNPEFLSDIGMFNALKLTTVLLNEKVPKNGGSTVAFTLKIGDTLWTAGLGDSRIILCTDEKVIPLSEDNDPANPREKKRIEKRGGRVTLYEGVPRVNGIFAPARSMGDHYPGVNGGADYWVMSARPGITKISLKGIKDKNPTLVCASDGLWNVASSNDIGRFLMANKERPLLEKTQEIAVRARLAGSDDDITVMLVPL